MSHLLDTRVVSEALKPRPDPNVVRWLEEQLPSSLFLSVVTIGEVRKGIEQLDDAERKQPLQLFLKTLKREHRGRILAIDEHVAEAWGRVMADAKRSGRPIGVPDALIAGTALRHGLKVVTRDVTHFEPAGVELLDPWDQAQKQPPG